MQSKARVAHAILVRQIKLNFPYAVLVSVTATCFQKIVIVEAWRDGGLCLTAGITGHYGNFSLRVTALCLTGLGS